MNTKIIQDEILSILSDSNIHYFREIITNINNKYPEYNFSIYQIHFQLTKLIKSNQCKRVCQGLYQKI